jgi:hypothetical protein
MYKNIQKTASIMHAYEFKVDGKVCHILAEHVAKDKTLKAQGKDKLEAINATIKKRYGLSGGGYTVPFGTIFDEDFNVISSPEVWQSRTPLTSSEVKYKLVDATFVHLYRLDGQIMLGTRNSWNITKSYDLYTDLTYGKAFNSCLTRLGIDIDDLADGSYAFSHPLLHPMAKDYRLYSFTNTTVGDDINIAFDEAVDEEEHILYYPDNKAYFEVVSEECDSARSLLYLNRQRFRHHTCDSISNELSMVNCILHFHCNATSEVRSYITRNKLLNEFALSCYIFVTSITRNIAKINPNDKNYYSVAIPTSMKRNYSPIPLYFSFWREVLANAYWNNLNKNKCEIPNFATHF